MTTMGKYMTKHQGTPKCASCLLENSLLEYVLINVEGASGTMDIFCSACERTMTSS